MRKVIPHKLGIRWKDIALSEFILKLGGGSNRTYNIFDSTPFGMGEGRLSEVWEAQDE